MNRPFIFERSASGEWIPYEGPRGGEGIVNTNTGEVRYNVDLDDVTEEGESELSYSLTDSEIGNIGGTVMPGEYRRDIQSSEDAIQALSEFNHIESNHPYDEWEISDSSDWVVGTYVRVQDDEFQLEGSGDDGVLGVIIESHPPSDVVLTENGETKYINQLDNMNDGSGDTAYILSTWNDAANRVATGQNNWSDIDNEIVPDNVPDQEDSEEEEDEDTIPHWASEDPLSELTESSPPESGLSADGVYTVNNQVTGLETNHEKSGDIQVYRTTDLVSDNRQGDSNVDYSEVDGVLCNANSSRNINTGEVQYIDFAEDSEYQDGWYEVYEEFIETVEGDSNSIGYRLWNQDRGEIEISGIEIRDAANAVHIPIENSYTSPLESTPTPSGEKNPDTWSIDWTSQDQDKTGNALPMAQKKLLIREWEAAIDNPEVTDSVRKTIRDVKDSTFNTQGQKYDKFIQALMDAEGEPRSNGFEDSDDPTEDEIEAMRLLQEASQKYFEENFGDSTEIYRSLAKYSHRKLLPQIKDAIVSDQKLADKEIELKDNPAGIWTTEEKSANAFTMIGGTAKSLVIEDVASKEDVFNMPDALFPYEQRENRASIDSDWDESEINVPSHGNRLQPNQIRVVQRDAFGDDRDIAPLEDVIDNPQLVVESGNSKAIASFLKTLDGFGDEEMYNAYKEKITSNNAIRESDGWESIDEQIRIIERNPGESVLFNTSKQQNSDIVTIDLTSETDSNWLHQHPKNTDKPFVKDDEWIPYEGPRGGEGIVNTNTGEVRYGVEISSVAETTETTEPLRGSVNTDELSANIREYIDTNKFESAGQSARRQEIENGLQKIESDKIESLSYREAYVISDVVSDATAEHIREFADSKEKQARDRLLDDIPIGEEFDGFVPMLVGGAVRDHYLGGNPEDIDLMAVPIPGETENPIETLESRMRYVDAESAFPVFIDSEGREVALPREEETTGAGFSDFETRVIDADTPVEESIEADMSRRDMTIGALAFDVRTGELYDPYGGRKDLIDRVIRPTSDAFQDDPVRALRAARFAPRFDFDVSDDIREMSRDMQEGVRKLPDERITQELRKTIKQADDSGRFFAILEDFELLDDSFPLVQEHVENVRESLKRVGEVTDSTNARLSALGSAMGSDASSFAASHTFSNEEKRAIEFGQDAVRLDEITVEDALNLADRIDSGRLYAADEIGALMSGLYDDAYGDYVEDFVGEALDAIQYVDGNAVMQEMGIQPSDIGTEIAPEEFGNRIRDARVDYLADRGFKTIKGKMVLEKSPSPEKEALRYKTALTEYLVRVTVDKSDEFVEKEWIPYQGPRGGEGVINTASGEVVYDTDPRYEQIISGDEQESDDDDSSPIPDEGVDRREEGYFVSASPNPERDIKEFSESESAQQMLDQTNSGPSEGFSIHRNLQEYDLGADDVWFVSITDVKVPASEGVQKSDVVEFYEEFISVLEETSAARIGGYHFEDGMRISIDLTIAITDQEEAERIGEELDQESIFNPKIALGDGDWDNGSIMTGGSGNSPIETPEEALNVIQNIEHLAKHLVKMRTQFMKQEYPHLERRYRGQDTGRVRTGWQIGFWAWKGGARVTSEDEDIIVNGERFIPEEDEEEV
jgi:tRNA nucleotidyltransferase/poly(A) polymerase